MSNQYSADYVKERVGETNRANNGLMMTIIAYRNGKDIDIQFENGTIVTNKDYRHFKEGGIACPNYKKAYPLKEDKTGETNTANNGLKMTIIAYRNAHDIDIKFENGDIVYNKAYKHFKEGTVASPLLDKSKKKDISKSKIGETVLNKNGEKMTIIGYRNKKDIDVKFEDGTIVYHKYYSRFKAGIIKKFNLGDVKPSKEGVKTSTIFNKIGETKVAFNGQVMKIIAFRGWDDIDIQFEDGTILTNRDYCAFASGNIKNPNLHIGETKKAKNGQTMTIIGYRSSQDMDVQFEDGTIVKNTRYDNFRNGSIKNYNARIGETSISSKGQKMTIIAYRGCNDLDIEVEDGTILEHKNYRDFKRGCIRNVNNRVGETSISKDGDKMTIIEYRNCNEVTIQFEDGVIVYDKTYSDFKRGSITKPNTASDIDYEKQKRLYHIAETVKDKLGRKISIIAYRGYNDIDVMFTGDGTIVKNQNYGVFKRGQIKNPKDYIGKTTKTKSGYNMTIIAFRSQYDIDIQFDDGTVVTNKTYQLFKMGEIGKPNIYDNRIGEVTTAKNGQKMTIIAYRSSADIDVQFEDGTIVKKKSYQSFNLGNIKNPNYIAPKTRNKYFKQRQEDRVGETKTNTKGQKMTIIAYRNSRDIDVLFEDNTVASHKCYREFKKGYIKKP